jgi:hypothetical protein
MSKLYLAFTPRYICYTLSILFTTGLLLIAVAVPASIYVVGIPLALFAGLTALGTRDLVQTRHSVLRSYPISAHLRFLLETMRPEMRQYFFESKKDRAPFSRDKRAVVYQRAKMALDKRPFGTQHDVYADGFSRPMVSRRTVTGDRPGLPVTKSFAGGRIPCRHIPPDSGPPPQQCDWAPRTYCISRPAGSCPA